jgi:hypothetical protein
MEARSATVATEDCGDAAAIEAAATTAASGDNTAPLLFIEASVSAEAVSTAIAGDAATASAGRAAAARAFAWKH